MGQPDRKVIKKYHEGDRISWCVKRVMPLGQIICGPQAWLFGLVVAVQCPCAGWRRGTLDRLYCCHYCQFLIGWKLGHPLESSSKIPFFQ